MQYILQKHEITFLQSLNCILESLYKEAIVTELRPILVNMISTGIMTQDELNKLQNLLPQFQERSYDNSNSNDVIEDWSEQKEDPLRKEKRELIQFLHQLVNKIFLQYAVYQGQLTKESKNCPLFDRKIACSHEEDHSQRR